MNERRSRTEEQDLAIKLEKVLRGDHKTRTALLELRDLYQDLARSTRRH